MTIHEPLHPGEIVREVLLGSESPFDNIAEAANALNVHRVTLSRLLNRHSNISPEMASRLALLLDSSINLWLGIQCDYDIAQAKEMIKNVKINKPRQLKTSTTISKQ